MELLKKLKTDRRYQLGAFIGGFVLISIIIWIVIFVFVFNNDPQEDFLSFKKLLPQVEEAEDNAPIQPRDLDGMMVAREDAHQWPVGIMIENAAFGGVRPQSGLAQALVVYEIIVEGGITRLMAVYAGESADEIGPVRSARDTYLEFASELQSVYGHAGGSFSALQALDSFSEEVVDLDALSGDGKYFYRKDTNYAPHNLFTSTHYLDLMLRDKELEVEAEFEPWKFTDSDPSQEEDKIDYIKVDFSAPSYLAEWKYNTDENYYERWNGGIAHVDANTGDVLTAKNIVVQSVDEGWNIEGKGRINFPVTGQGEAHIFNDGKVTQATWKKEDRTSRTKYYNEQEEEIEFVRGNSWVEILPVTSSLEYN